MGKLPGNHFSPSSIVWQLFILISAVCSIYQQCTMCTLYSFFSSRPSEVRLILKSPKCCTIQHKFVPARSVERNIEKIRFPWASNSKFVIFSQIFPRSNYKICPIIPRLFPVSNGDSPVSTTFPRSNYRGFFTTGESYCTMYTLCNGTFKGRLVFPNRAMLYSVCHKPDICSTKICL